MQKHSCSDHYSLSSRYKHSLKIIIKTVSQDESLTSFVRGALKIRTCHSIYKSCHKILEWPEVWEHRDKRIKVLFFSSFYPSYSFEEQFESGVRLGVGCFSLMISCLPPKVLKLLAVVGFTGDKVPPSSHSLHLLLLRKWEWLNCISVSPIRILYELILEHWFFSHGI